MLTGTTGWKLGSAAKRIAPAPPHAEAEDDANRVSGTHTFTLSTHAGTYTFDQIPEMLLAGDSDTTIPG
jgi:hypothetical protein